jgi:hypothetical protein
MDDCTECVDQRFGRVMAEGVRMLLVEVDDGFRIEEGYQLVSGRPACMHAQQSILPDYVALSRDIPPPPIWGFPIPEESAAHV